jgi:hypothetical protein
MRAAKIIQIESGNFSYMSLWVQICYFSKLKLTKFLTDPFLGGDD